MHGWVSVATRCVCGHNGGMATLRRKHRMKVGSGSVLSVEEVDLAVGQIMVEQVTMLRQGSG